MSEQTTNLPTPEDEEQLNNIAEDTPTMVELRGKKIAIGWLKRGTIRKFTNIMSKSGNDDKVSCQAVAAIVLNGYWAIKFRWWFLWRWYYYIKQYGDNELGPIIAMAKKKIPVRAYFAATILLTAMKDTMMTMTKEEANNILQEPSTAKPGKSQKTTPG